MLTKTDSSVDRAVPICTALAPARKNSTASRQLVMPPHPNIGVFGKASNISYTQRKAMGLIAGPERPPRLLARIAR